MILCMASGFVLLRPLTQVEITQVETVVSSCADAKHAVLSHLTTAWTAEHVVAVQFPRVR